MASAPLLLLAAALAGLASLAAQSLGVRAIARATSGTGEALAAIAAVFLAGLAAGAAAGGRAAARSRRPMRSAALAALAAGTWIAALPWLLATAGGLQDALLDRLGFPPGHAAGTSALVAAPFLLPPALLLGFLLPLLVRAQAPHPHPGHPHPDHGMAGHATTERRGGGVVVGATVLGGAFGAPSAVLLLGTVGETRGLVVAGGIAVAAALVLLLSERPGAPPETASDPSGREPASDTSVRRPARGAGALAFAAGSAAALAAAAWFRWLLPLAGESSLGAASILFAILLAGSVGMGLGAWVPRRGGGTASPAVLLALAGIALAGSIPLAGLGPWLLLAKGAAGPFEHAAALAAAVFAAVAPAALLFGAALPPTVSAAARGGSPAGAATGEVFGWGLAGLALGHLAATFLLIPRLGPAGSLLLAAAVAAVAAATWLLRAGGARAVASLAVVLPVLAIALPPVQRRMLNAGPSAAEVAAAAEPLRAGIRLDTPSDVRLYAEIFFGTVVDERAGRAATAALLEERGVGVRLRVDGASEGRLDLTEPERAPRTETALGLLPAALHPSPRRALVIGHGMGWTAEALLAAGLEAVDVTECDAAVGDVVGGLRGAPLPVERDPRARLIVADGRRTMRRAARGAPSDRYDLIASHPSRPGSPASAPPFTEEAWREARAALAPGGVLAQRFDLEAISPEALQAAFAAFHAVFPDAWGFRFEGELVLLGFTGPGRIDATRWERVVASAQRLEAFRDAPDLFKHVAFDASGFARILEATATAASDDRPRWDGDLGLDRLLGRAATSGDVVAPAFPPSVHVLLPDAATRERWCRQATASWLAADRPDLALLWATSVPWGLGADAKRVRGSVQAAVGDLRRSEEFLRAAAEEAPDRPDLLAAWILSLGIPARDGRLLPGTLEKAARMAERFGEDGRVLAALGRMWVDALFYEPGRDAYRRALAATGAKAPAGTGSALARLLVAGGEGEDAPVRELLRADPATYEDLDALTLLWQMETRIGERADADRLGAALLETQARQGHVKLEAGARALREGRFAEALESTAAAKSLRPGDPVAWEERALALLAWRRLPGLPHARRVEAEDEAVAALGEAVRRWPDPVAARARGRAILRWHGLAEDLLPAGPPEAP